MAEHALQNDNRLKQCWVDSDCSIEEFFALCCLVQTKPSIYLITVFSNVYVCGSVCVCVKG